ncbi:hypothetical protein [Tautonia plasticadhaerens]|uniref:Uncharacterized protein n=1 Tax=Tautonia plasticadhaerens TaxID=2527974 RepID=A0A518H2E3_9BACT|nr:hypothetical protein [Tautonia plasticadhaerens]QDV34985.1 hypothetical protein ElP_28820 [Tautonia plasticadhaerens]
MRFNSWFGAFVQTQPMAEGGRLIAAGLLRPVYDGRDVIGVESTAALAGSFERLPEMERLYPLLVEFLACCRFAGFPGFCTGDAGQQLRALGMSEEGLVALRRVAG